jgi:hypothetical protein
MDNSRSVTLANLKIFKNSLPRTNDEDSMSEIGFSGKIYQEGREVHKN